MLTITDRKFKEEFNVNNENDIDIFIESVHKYDVNNLIELKMKANIAKYVECSEMRLMFSD